MSFDSIKDARRLRCSLFFGSLAAAVVLGVVALHGSKVAWRELQDQYRQTAGVSADGQLGVVQLNACTDEVDRCTTCHLGAERPDLAGASVPLPFRAHSAALGRHALDRVGCSSCHGGSPRALDLQVAHGSPGSPGRDPLMRQPHLQASCARCHVPGDGPGTERLVRGATLYLELGCLMCHPLTRAGRGGWDFGPDLRSIGRRSLKYLETSLLDPVANFSESTMPSFAHTFADDRDSLADLILFLESLVLERAQGCSLRSRSTALVGLPCASCHSGPMGKAGGQFRHRCVYLQQRRAELDCGGCHGAGVPSPGAGGGLCPVVRAQSRNCVVCHDEPGEGREP